MPNRIEGFDIQVKYQVDVSFLLKQCLRVRRAVKYRKYGQKFTNIHKVPLHDGLKLHVYCNMKTIYVSLQTVDRL